MLKKKPRTYIIVGITGGIGSGKSVVTNEFKKRNAFIIDADEIARKIVKPKTPAWFDIKKNFGNSVIYDNGLLNRSRLGMIVFEDQNKRRLLEKITHPRIITEQNRIISTLNKALFQGVIVIDAALLIESGYYKEVDKLIVVYSTVNIQVQRLIQRDSISQSEAMKRIKTQMPLHQKVNHADYIIINNFSLESVKKRAGEVYKKILK